MKTQKPKMTMYFQFNLVANDQGIPQRTATIEVTITVQRDENPTFFLIAEKNVTIDDKYQVLQFVDSMPATDGDLRRVSFFCSMQVSFLSVN